MREEEGRSVRTFMQPSEVYGRTDAVAWEQPDSSHVQYVSFNKTLSSTFLACECFVVGIFYAQHLLVQSQRRHPRLPRPRCP